MENISSCFLSAVLQLLCLSFGLIASIVAKVTANYQQPPKDQLLAWTVTVMW